MMLPKRRLSGLKKLGGKLRRGQRQRGIGLRRIRMIGRMIVSTITRMLDGALDIENPETDSVAFLWNMERLDGFGLGRGSLEEGYARAKSPAVLIELYNTCNNRIIELNASTPLSGVYKCHQRLFNLFTTHTLRPPQIVFCTFPFIIFLSDRFPFYAKSLALWSISFCTRTILAFGQVLEVF
jgi:hypothetical protein